MKVSVRVQQRCSDGNRCWRRVSEACLADGSAAFLWSTFHRHCFSFWHPACTVIFWCVINEFWGRS